jgi:hypothetical protein
MQTGGQTPQKASSPALASHAAMKIHTLGLNAQIHMHTHTCQKVERHATGADRMGSHHEKQQLNLSCSWSVILRPGWHSTLLHARWLMVGRQQQRAQGLKQKG